MFDNMRTHPVTFLIERGVENATEAAARALLNDINRFMAGTDREAEFQSIQIVDEVPKQFPGTLVYPEGAVPVEFWIRKGPAVGHGFYGLGSGGEIIGRWATPRMFVPSDTSSATGAFTDWQFHLHIALHEVFGHGCGCSSGDYTYALFTVDDPTPLPPRLDIHGAHPGDDWWAKREELKRDFMFNPHPDPQWCDLNRAIIRGEYRIPKRLPNVPLGMLVSVVDSETGKLVDDAAFWVFDCAAQFTSWRQVANGKGGQLEFPRWANESMQSTELATLVKAYAPGYLPAAVWYTRYDAEVDVVLNGFGKSSVVVAMERIPDNPWIKAVSMGAVTIGRAARGEAYLVSEFVNGQLVPVKVFAADASGDATVPIDGADGIRGYAVAHLPGAATLMERDPEGAAAAMAAPAGARRKIAAGASPTVRFSWNQRLCEGCGYGSGS